jgi:hypothetical protein
MAMHVRRDLPTRPGPKWQKQKVWMVGKYRALYRKTADWVIQNMYGSGITYETDHSDSCYDFITKWIETPKPESKAKGRNLVHLRKERSYPDKGRQEFRHTLSGYQDAVTAIYIPCTESSKQDGFTTQIPNRLTLVINGTTMSTWYRNPATGLFDGATMEHDMFTPLREFLDRENEDFRAIFDNNKTGNAEITALERLLIYERTERLNQAQQGKDAFFHTQSAFIGPHEGYERWQRIVLIQPCMPQILLGHSSIDLFFDCETELLIEGVMFHDREQQYADKTESKDSKQVSNPFLGTDLAVLWIEEPERARAESESPPLVICCAGLCMLKYCT